MKTIYSILIAILVFSPIVMSLRSEQSSTIKILIQSSDKNIIPGSLSASVGVISGRLKDYCPGKYGISLLQQKKQIEVLVKDITDLKRLESLIIRKGSSGFFETGDNTTAGVKGTDIERAIVNNGRIQITLKKDAVKTWADMTRRNLDKEIALKIDDAVIFAPKVKAVIDSGKIEISGSFTPEELKFIAAILNNGELPADFYVVK